MRHITLDYRKVALAKRRGGGGVRRGRGVEGWGQGWSAQDIHYTIFLLDVMTFNVRNVKEKGSPVSAILPIFNCLSPTLAVRHQGQSGTAGHGLVQGMKICNSLSFSQNCKQGILRQP
jgi:hypothetical protein